MVQRLWAGRLLRHRKAQLLLVNLLTFGLEVCLAAGITYVPPLLLEVGVEEKFMTMVLGEYHVLLPSCCRSRTPRREGSSAPAQSWRGGCVLFLGLWSRGGGALQGGGVTVGWTRQGGPIGKEHRDITWSPQYP